MPLSRLTRGTGVLGSVPEMLTTGTSNCLTHAASLGVFSAAMIPSPRHPRRSSTDIANDSGDVMYDQLQLCSVEYRSTPVINTSWWAPRGNASAISLARFGGMKYNGVLQNLNACPRLGLSGFALFRYIIARNAAWMQCSGG